MKGTAVHDTDQIKASSANTADTRAEQIERLIAVLPDAIDQSMKTALPEGYTPELAAQFAETMAACLRQATVTAAQRGTEWMLRFGCPPWCIENHGQPGALECHAGALSETKLRISDVDSSGYSEYGETVPWLSAQVVVMNDRAQAYGRETRVWLSSGVHLAEISPAKAREALEAMRGFVSQLEAVVDDADRIAADDFAGDPEIARLDTEAADARVKRITEASAKK